MSSLKSEVALVALVAAIIFVLVANPFDSGSSSSSNNDGAAQHRAVDSKGFPLNGQGNVSSNPNDYRELVCDRVGDMAADYESEC